MSDIGRHGVAAVKWSALSTAARFMLQLMAQVVLARTLGPEIFGIFAIGLVVLTFAAFFSGFGFSWSLLQRTELQAEDIRFAWTWQLIVGVLTMVAVYLSAPAIASYFRDGRVENVVQWLSLGCLLTAATAPATYLLQRDLNFRAVGMIQVGSYAVGYVAIGMPMAIFGFGTASLITAWLVQAAVQLIASYAVKPHPLRPLFWYPGASSAVGTGRTVFITNVVNWILNNLDRILIGRLLNAHALGLYNMAYNLATMPNSLLLGALQPAFLAAGARLQDQPERLGKAYLQMMATVFVLVVPAFVFLCLVSSDLVRLFYGPKWADAAWVLGALFISMPAYVIWGLSTPVLWNTGRKHYEFALQLPLVLAGAWGFYWFGRDGIQAAAVVAGALLVARAVVIATAAFRALHLPGSALVSQAARGLLLSVTAAAGALGAQYATASLDIALVSLAGSTLLASLLTGLLIALRPGVLGDEASSMIVRFFPRMSRLLDKDRPPSTVRDALGEQHP